MTTQTYYDVLEVSTAATPLDIKKSYRRLALLHHPDRNNGSRTSEEKFKLIGQAYDVLSDPVKKSDYDASLKDEGRRQPWQQSTQQYQSTQSDNQTRDARRSRVFPMRHPASNFDAFAQFDRNFGNDPFFQEAFRDLDEEFTRRFQSRTKGEENTNSSTPSQAVTLLSKSLPVKV